MSQFDIAVPYLQRKLSMDKISDAGSVVNLAVLETRPEEDTLEALPDHKAEN